MYSHFRLVMTDGDRIITGQELKDILISQGFSIPVIEPAMNYLPKWAGGRRQSKDPAYIEWGIACTEVRKTCNEDFLRWTNEVNAVADMLKEKFVIATLVGNEWQLIPPIYTFPQAAQKLTGCYGRPRPVDSIDFICNKYFG